MTLETLYKAYQDLRELSGLLLRNLLALLFIVLMIIGVYNMFDTIISPVISFILFVIGL
jgi:hypothetical protein